MIDGVGVELGVKVAQFVAVCTSLTFPEVLVKSLLHASFMSAEKLKVVKLELCIYKKHQRPVGSDLSS